VDIPRDSEQQFMGVFRVVCSGLIPGIRWWQLDFATMGQILHSSSIKTRETYEDIHGKTKYNIHYPGSGDTYGTEFFSHIL
jgi:hypothetical protein